MDTRDSIEDFILRIEDLNSRTTEEIISLIKESSLEQKIDYAKNLLFQFQSQNEILFILDKGCIIQPNKLVASWFSEVVGSDLFKSNTVICLVSSFRPLSSKFHVKNKIIAFHVNELNPSDRQVLFIKYCELLEINPSKQNIDNILSVLNGMPSQIFFTSYMIKENGSDFVVKHIEEVKKYDDFKVFNTIDMIRNSDEQSFNILLFIARFEFVSFEMIYRIFKRNNETDNSLDTLFIYGVYDKIGIDKEYVKVHHAISDYILRAKMELPPHIQKSLKLVVEDLITNASTFPDASEILVTIKSLIQNNIKIPEKYFIPSVALRTIIELYYERNYAQVELLAERMLSNFRKYDEAIVRDIRYYFCMALARQKKELFFEHLRFFEDLDYNFLLGFYRRIQKKNSEAEKYFLNALDYDPESQKTRRELVNVLLSQGKYGMAVEWARKNYEKKPLNAFHIQAYFICLLRKSSWSPSEREIIEELLINIQKSHDYKGKEIFQVMKGEYEYYIRGHFEQAVKLLKEAKEKCEFKNYPIKALMEIYKRKGLKDKEKMYSDMINLEEEEISDI